MQVQRDVGDVHAQVLQRNASSYQHMGVLHHRIVTLQSGVNQKADHLNECDTAATLCPLPRSSAFSLTSQHDAHAMVPPHYTVESKRSILPFTDRHQE